MSNSQAKVPGTGVDYTGRSQGKFGNYLTKQTYAFRANSAGNHHNKKPVCKDTGSRYWTVAAGHFVLYFGAKVIGYEGFLLLHHRY